ncbi:hypothetical protein OHT20_25495 [Streptomyces caniferus]|uniref:hypothetical protein n=1 Tax=Streptomyces caniferus TaxID=285557 RepID=UPI002E29183A|nr:hypothetical protein [Streptomyces caniferus]
MLRTTSRRTAAAAAAGAAALGLTLTLAASGPASAAAHPQSAPAAAGVRSDPNGRHTAAEIHRFLTSFYGQHGPDAGAREHQVSDHLKDRAAHTEGYDLLLCAQNTLRRITVGKVTTAQSAGVGWATVTTFWGGGTRGSFTAYVGLESRPIVLQDVDCGW